jgi:transcriptional regulator with XRE-family HTH domain
MQDSTIYLDTEKVRLLRKEKGFSQFEMADLLDIDQSTYSKVEKGITKIDLQRLFKLSEILTVSPMDLLQVKETTIFNINSEKNIVNGRVENFYADNNQLHQKVLELEIIVKELTALFPKK